METNKVVIRKEKYGLRLFACPKCGEHVFFGISRCQYCHHPLEWRDTLDELCDDRREAVQA